MTNPNPYPAHFSHLTDEERLVAVRVAGEACQARLGLLLHTAGRPMTAEEIALHARFLAIEEAANERLAPTLYRLA